MPTDNNNRNAFLRALLNQRRLTEASGGVLVNPSVPQPTVEVDETTPAPQVGSDVDFEAAIETQPTTKLSNNIATYDPEKAKDQSSDNWFVQAWDTITGFLDGITFNLIGGVLNFGESILDFASNTIGWIGDATGWYDSDPFTNWAKKDYATMTAEWMKTYANATPWGAINSIRSLAEYGADEYFGSASNTLGDITSSFFTNDDLDTTIESFDAYYAGDDSFYDTQTGQVIGSIANSIGFMLPSIALGAVTGGAGTVVSLASMGLASAGQGTEEALGEGASAGEALGYGLASGAVETATEIVVGPALKFVGLGTGKVMGVVGKTATKSFAKALGQTMFEEGMEEVVSAIAQPLIQSIYKGEDAFKDDEGNNIYASTDFWFGTNGHFAESVAGSFVAGAAAGGIMGGVSLKQQYNTFSADGIDTIEKFGEVVKADNKMAKLEQRSDFDANSKAYQQAVEDRQNALSEFTLAEDRLLASGNEKHIKNVARAILNPSQINTIANSDTQSESEQISQLLTSHRDELQSHNKTYIRNSFNHIQRQYGTDYKLEFGKVKDNNEAYVNHDTKTIIINDSIVDKRGGSALAHEYIGHVLGTQLSSGSRTILYQDIVDTDWYKETETNLRKLYENDEIYNSFETAREKTAYWQEEVIANYMGDFFDGKNVASQIHELEKTFGNQNFLERFLNAVNNVTKFKGKNIAQKYRETIDKTIKGLLKTNSGKNNRILRTLKKFMNGEELSRSERNIQRQYKNLFELFSENNALAEAYSKNSDLDTLSNEKLISKIEENEHLANIKQWKYFNNLIHKDLVKVARAANKEVLTYDEVVDVQAVKDALNYVDAHEDLQVIEHPELVEQTTNEFIDKIIKDAKTNGEVAKDKKVLVLIGLPGAGKSVYAREYMKQFGNAIQIDNDIAKEVPCLSKYYDGGLGAGVVQKIVSKAELNAIESISKEGYNVLFPMIGKSEKSIVNRLIDFEKAGYTIDLTYVAVDKNTSYTRTFNRFLDTGRFVSPDYIKSIDESKIDSIYNDIERTHEITYGNQTIHFQRTSKYDNRATQKRFSRSSEETKFFKENDKSGDGSRSRVDASHNDGMVSDASERRRNNNSSKGVSLSRVDESNSNQAHLNLAISYDDTIDYEQYASKFKELRPKLERDVKQLSSAFNFDAKLSNAIGGWTFTDNANAPSIAGEPSFPITINNYQNIEDVKLFASILADTAYEVQNVVGVIEYNVNGTSTEFELPITKVDNGLKEILKKVNFDGFTIDTEAKTITINNTEYGKITLLAEELKKNGYFDETREIERNTTSEDWLDTRTRQLAYRAWLQANSSGQQDGLLRRYVEKAQKVNQYILNNLDENGQRLPNTINNSDDILRHLRTSTFKSVDTVKDIIKSSKEFIESKLGGEYIVSMSQNLRDLSRKSFSAINDRASLLRQTNDVIDLLLDTRVEYLNPDTHTYEYVGALSEFINDEQTQEVRNKLQDLISSASNSQVRNRSARDFEITISRLLDSMTENNVKADRSIVLNNLRTRIRKNIDRYYQISSNDIERNGLKMLLAPFEQIHNRRGFSSRDLKENLRKALEWYNEDYLSKNNISLPFSSELRDKLLELYDSIGEPKVQTLKTGQTREVYGTLTTESINLAIDSIRLINSEIRNMLVEYETLVKPAAEQSYKVIEGLTRNDTGLVRKLLNSYHRSFAPAYSVIRSILGPNSYLSNLLTRDMQIAENNRSLYVGDIMSEQVNKKIKELGIKPRTLTNARLEIAGQDLSITQAMYLYNSLNVEANFNAIDENGLQYKNKNGQLSKLFGKGEAQNILDELETKLEKPYKELANHMLSIMNGQIKQDYIAWYENRYGKFQGRNEIGNVGENTYWMLLRSYNRYNDVEKAVSNPSAVFSRARSRTGSSDAVFIGDVFSAFEHYVNQFATEQFLKPVYRQASQILRTKLDGKGAKTVYELLNQKYGLNGKDVRYLETTMKDVLGALQTPREGILNRISSMYAISKLSLNVGSVLKQFSSIWTSNIPIAKSTKAAIARLTRNSAARSEYNQLIDRIGGLKYRERNAGVIQANVGSYSDRYRNIMSKGMIGLSKADFFTVGTGVYSLMYIAQDQYGYKIGTEENMNFVVEHWSDFELTQSGNTPLQRSALFRGDLGSIAKSLFGFLQGENRAILGSFIEKISLYRQFRNVNQNEIKNNLNEARSKLELAENEYHANPDSEDLRNAYITAQADYFDAEVRNKNFERFNVMGGKNIPVNMLSGMATQAIFIALINELMRHLRGKEEWDEWDFVNVGIDAVTSLTVDWVPLANVIANLIQGYEVTVPVIDLLNQMSSMISNVQNGSFSMSSFIQMLSDLTGVPLSTLISYAKGITNAFAPEIALEIDNFMYGVTSTSMSNSMKEYRDKGNRERVSMFVKENTIRFKTGYISERVQTELTNLYMAGYNALPKDYITTYVNENGMTISLNASQISAFKMAYDDSDKAIRELLTTSEYMSMTQEEKANTIKKIYDYFFEYAKAKVLKTEVSSKVVNVLLQTNGSIAIGKYISILSLIQGIKASSTKTRKELVLDYINSMSNLSRQEKLLVMYLAGYGLSEESTNTLKRYLISKGISASDANTLLKV